MGRGCARLDLERMMARICVWGGGKGFWEGEGVSREGLGVGQGWWKYRGFGEKSGSDCWEGGRVGPVGEAGGSWICHVLSLYHCGRGCSSVVFSRCWSVGDGERLGVGRVGCEGFWGSGGGLRWGWSL